MMIEIKNDSPRVSPDAKQKVFLRTLRDQGGLVPYDQALELLDKPRLSRLFTERLVNYDIDAHTVSISEAGRRAVGDSPGRRPPPRGPEERQ